MGQEGVGDAVVRFEQHIDTTSYIEPFFITSLLYLETGP